MKLIIEKDVKTAVEVNGQIMIDMQEGILYQSISDDEILLYIKSNKDDKKEIKLRILKETKILKENGK